MASIPSLDRDLRSLRLSKYTPQAANETRTWIEAVLGEALADGDLLDALKSGVALCKLVNLAVPSSIRFKDSAMPFVQMENISHFLRACQQAPLSLQSHDIFQTVDLYESKDPAQVLQCISAFSRRANALNPTNFPSAIGGDRSKGGVATPQSTGGGGGAAARFGRPRGVSNTSETSSNASHPSQAVGGRGSPARMFERKDVVSSPSGGVSSWSNRKDETGTAPAWNIHQYGYMGGASQGNQGISFGARRQITTPAPKVPSLAEKERKRQEQQAEEERNRLQAEEEQRRLRLEREAEEERDKIAEDKRLEEAARVQREDEQRKIEEEKRRWAEEERRWREEEQARAKEEADVEAKSQGTSPTKSPLAADRPRLHGQYLSQYQAEQKRLPSADDAQATRDRERVKELERQLAEAKERETRYEMERGERLANDERRNSAYTAPDSSRARSRSKSRTRPVPYGSNMTETESERSLLQQAWQTTNEDVTPLSSQPPRPLPIPGKATQPPEKSPTQRQLPIPEPRVVDSSEEGDLTTISADPTPTLPLPTRPLPDPNTYTVPARSSPSPVRKSPFARPTSKVPAQSPTQSSLETPSSPRAVSHPTPQQASQSSQVLPSAPDPSSAIAPAPAPASAMTTPSSTSRGRPSPSGLLAREMELDRQRQEEWAEAQAATASRRPDPSDIDSSGPGGGAWDVHQYGYLGGDSQNRGNVGIGGFGGARRQLVGGPREMPGSASASKTETERESRG